MKNDKLLPLMIMFADMVVLMLVVIGAYFIFTSTSTRFAASLSNIPAIAIMFLVSYMASYSIYPPIVLRRIVKLEQVIRRCIATSTGMILITSLLILFLTKGHGFPRTYLGTVYLTFTVLLVFERMWIRKLFRIMHIRKRHQRNVVLLGSEDTIVRLYKILSHPVYGYNVIGIFYDGPKENSPLADKHLGQINDLFAWLAAHKDIHEIYGYFPKESQNMINVVSKFCDNNLIRFFYVPAFDIYNGNVSVSYIENVPVIARRPEPLADPFNKMLKRTFDLICSILFLLLIFPWLFIIVAIGIKISSPGPIFFVQKRTGLNGHVFKCIKFRTMHVNKDADKVQATKDDPRKFKFGNILRKTNIDEMPQFINVFLGNMSVVGPRPHMLLHTEEYSRIINRFMVRHLAKPGITGLAQVSGYRGETRYIDQMEGRIKKDIEYIENWTFLLDIKIIILTITNMLGGEKNAY